MAEAEEKNGKKKTQPQKKTEKIIPKKKGPKKKTQNKILL